MFVFERTGMAYPAYLREKARELRRERNLTIDELADRLALSRTTLYYWVCDLPITRTERQSAAQRRGTRGMRQKYLRARQEAYVYGQHEFDRLAHDLTFRDFGNLYIAEGYRRTRHQVSLGNSDPAVVKLAARWIEALTTRPVTYTVTYHADQDVNTLRAFWASTLEIDPGRIRFQPKTNSNHLRTKTWRCQWG